MSVIDLDIPNTEDSWLDIVVMETLTADQRIARIDTPATGATPRSPAQS